MARKSYGVVCENCGHKYYVPQWRRKKTRFCSRRCIRLACPEVETARIKAIVTHGRKGTVEYRCWCAMKSRCKGGWYLKKGITVCLEWQKDFMAFYNYLGPIPGKHYTVDRHPNNEGNYEPGNVRWATKAEQGWSKKGKKHTNEWKVAASLRTRGTNAANVKLTDDDVRAIRILTGKETRIATGKRFGVHRRTIQGIQERTSWKHVT